MNKAHNNEKQMATKKFKTKKPHPVHSRPSVNAGVWWKQQLTDFGNTVAVSGLGYVVDKNQTAFRRFFWVLLILSGVVIMSYQMVERTLYYFKYPTSISLEEIYPDTLRFPSITVCNENIFMKSPAKGFNLYDDLQALYEPKLASMSAQYTVNWTRLVQNVKIAMIVTNSSRYSDLYNHMAQSSAAAIETCSIDNKPCSYHNFTDIVTDIGLCRTFNPKGDYHATRAGLTAGLYLLMEADQDQYFTSPTFAAGFRVILHEPDDFPQLTHRSFKVPVGGLSTAKINARKVKRLSPPHGTCTSSRHLTYFATYSRYNCEMECHMKHVIDTCLCAEFYYPQTVHDQCSLQEESTCVRPAVEDFQNRNLLQFCNCTDACETTEYIESVSFTEAADYVKQYMVNYSYVSSTTFLEKNVCVLTIYLSTMSYQLWDTEEIYSLTSLFCDYGGALGLLLGSTFFTLFELLDFFFWTTVAWQKRKQEVGTEKMKLQDDQDDIVITDV